MSNRFYVPGKRRGAGVQDLFAGIAARYDLINDAQSFGFHRWWKRRMVRLAEVRPGEEALDVCCGTGDLAFALARRGARVTGLDFSGAMLEVAKSRWVKEGKSGVPNPAFIQGDAQQLPFRQDTFDVVTVGYGLRNLADWELGLREMRRVTRPGGRLLVLDFGKPDNRLWRAIYFTHLKFSVPWMGRLLCGNQAAYAYIHESLMHYPAQRRLAEKMRELELKGVRIINLLGGVMSINYGQK